jgi:preprotein translocase subunit SecF
MSNLSIDFMGQRKYAAVLSGLLILVSLFGIVTKGLNLGLDFSSGTLIELEYSEPANLEQVREVLNDFGITNPIAVPFGSEREVMVRFQGSFTDIATAKISQTLLEVVGEDARIESVERMSAEYQNRITMSPAGLAEQQDALLPSEIFGPITARNERDETVFQLRNDLDNSMSNYLVAVLAEAAGSKVEKKRSEFVGPQVGDELAESAIWGALTSLAVVMLYVALRFQFKFSVGAVTALAHDVIIVVGLFALFQWDFDLTVFAAILAVIGYSLNDTIVVSDRIRENFRKVRNREAVEIINISLNQTFGRTLVTSLTTLLVLLALFFIGGETIHNFSLGLIIGVVVGTYSSIYVAANIMVAMKISKEDLIVPVKEGAEFDEIP